jgi:hypothetical protein
MKKVIPPELDKIADAVLAYRPKKKVKRKKNGRQKKSKRESSI